MNNVEDKKNILEKKTYKIIKTRDKQTHNNCQNREKGYAASTGNAYHV